MCCSDLHTQTGIDPESSKNSPNLAEPAYLRHLSAIHTPAEAKLTGKQQLTKACIYAASIAKRKTATVTAIAIAVHGGFG